MLLAGASSGTKNSCIGFSIPALRNRECIVVGEGVSIPIRVSFDTLEEVKRPASEDPSFVELWRQSGGEEEAVIRTVQRWRAQSK